MFRKMLREGEEKFPLTEIVFFLPSQLDPISFTAPSSFSIFLFEPRAPPVTSVFLLENKLHPFPTQQCHDKQE